MAQAGCWNGGDVCEGEDRGMFEENEKVETGAVSEEGLAIPRSREAFGLNAKPSLLAFAFPSAPGLASSKVSFLNQLESSRRR